MNDSKQESNVQRVKRRMSQVLKLNVPDQQDTTLQDLSKHGSFQNGNMVIDSEGIKVKGDKSLAQSLGGMSLESLGQDSSNNMEKMIEKLDNQQEQQQQQQIQKDSEGFGIPLTKKQLQQNNKNLNQIQNNAQQYYNQNICQNSNNVQMHQLERKNMVQNQDDNVLESQSYQIPFEEIKKIKVVGQGSGGIVEKALHKPTNTFIALKSIPLHTDENFKKQVNIELNTLIKCKSDHIVKCYGACLNQGNITIALEYMDMGTLFDIQQKVGQVPEVVLGIITVQILKGLDYLHHNLRVIHRDIKPQNLLVSSTGHVKIADFGVSGKIVTNQDQITWLGTVTYMSPERLKGEKYKADTDLWSLGITLVELAHGKYPHFQSGENSKNQGFWELLNEIENKDSPQFPSNYSEDMQDFLRICLNKDSTQRKSAGELLQHPVIKLYETLDESHFRDWLEPLQSSQEIKDFNEHINSSE